MGEGSGKIEWAGCSYADDGTMNQSTGNGVFNSCGTIEWRVRTFNVMADGTVLLTDAVASLKARTLNGTVYEWE